MDKPDITEKFVCSWEDCRKEYASKDAFKKHQRQKQHMVNDVATVGKLRCHSLSVRCGERFLLSVSRWIIITWQATFPVYIAASVDLSSGAVSVSFCQYHAGHSLDLGHLRLPEATRLEVAAMLQQGVTMIDVIRVSE